MLRIRSTKPGGFYRLGIKFPPEGQDFPEGTFSDEQLQVLQDERMLVVEVVPDPPEAKGPKPKKGQKNGSKTEEGGAPGGDGNEGGQE